MMKGEEVVHHEECSWYMSGQHGLCSLSLTSRFEVSLTGPGVPELLLEQSPQGFTHMGISKLV
jgi:hypothetical protein